MSERESAQRERGATTVVRPEGRGPDHWEERAESERESAQRERGASTVVRPEGRGPDHWEERVLSERESAQRERGPGEREAHGGGDVLLGLFGPAEEQTWQERALCAQTDPEAFFPEKGGSTREAKRICSTCEVRSECLEYALEHDERFGIWGGLSERERRRVKRHAV
jgi:WhiB family transcriptional regulator, redox-sensing transcriptional regulator